MKNIKVQEWIFLILTNAKAKGLNVKNKEKSGFVGESEFMEFYGYTYSSRAQYASSMFTDLRPIFELQDWLIHFLSLFA